MRFRHALQWSVPKSKGWRSEPDVVQNSAFTFRKPFSVCETVPSGFTQEEHDVLFDTECNILLQWIIKCGLSFTSVKRNFWYAWLCCLQWICMHAFGVCPSALFKSSHTLPKVIYWLILRDTQYHLIGLCFLSLCLTEEPTEHGTMFYEIHSLRSLEKYEVKCSKFGILEKLKHHLPKNNTY